MRDNSPKWVLRQRRRDRDRGERWRGSNNIMVYSYISVVLWREVWSFPTCLQPLCYPYFLHQHTLISRSLLSIPTYSDTHPSPLTYSYPLRPISLVGSQRSPVPTPPKSSLPHLSPNSSPLSHPFSTLPLSLSVLGRSEQHCRCCGHRLMTRGCEQAKNPSRVKDERKGWYFY